MAHVKVDNHMPRRPRPDTALVVLNDNRLWVRPQFEAMSAWLPVAIIETEDIVGGLRKGRFDLMASAAKRLSPSLWSRRLLVPTRRAYDLMRHFGPSVAKAVHEGRRALGARRAVVIYTYPYYAPCARRHLGDASVYYAHDHFQSYGGVWSWLVQRAEDEILRQVDVGAFISQLRIEEAARRPGYRGTPLAHLPLATDRRFIPPAPQTRPGKPPQDLAGIARPIVGCVGSLSVRVDYEWILRLAAKLPHASFVFVGFGKDPEGAQTLGRCPNVHLLGWRKREILPHYMRSFDACLMPINTQNEGRYACPTRLFDYLASTRPIVSTPLRSVLDFRDVLFASEDVDACADFIQKVCREGCDGREQDRWQLAHEHTWDARAVEWLDVLQGHGIIEGVT